MNFTKQNCNTHKICIIVKLLNYSIIQFIVGMEKFDNKMQEICKGVQSTFTELSTMLLTLRGLFCSTFRALQFFYGGFGSW